MTFLALGWAKSYKKSRRNFEVAEEHFSQILKLKNMALISELLKLLKFEVYELGIEATFTASYAEFLSMVLYK